MITKELSGNSQEALLRVYTGEINLADRFILFRWDTVNTKGIIIRKGEYRLEGVTLNKWFKLPIADQASAIFEYIAVENGL